MISSPPATRRPRGQASYVSPDDTATWTTHGSRDAWLHLSPPHMRSVDPPTSTPTMRMSPTCKAATKLSRGQASYVTAPGVTARRSGLLMAAVTRDCTSRRFSCSRSPAHLTSHDADVIQRSVALIRARFRALRHAPEHRLCNGEYEVSQAK